MGRTAECVGNSKPFALKKHDEYPGNMGKNAACGFGVGWNSPQGAFHHASVNAARAWWKAARRGLFHPTNNK